MDLLLQLRELMLSKTAKDTSVVFAGNAASSALAIIFIILAARSLGPEGWGIAAGVMSFISIAIAFGDFGLSAGLFRFVSKLWSKNDKRQAEGILRTVFSLRLLTASTLAFVITAFSFLLAPFLKVENPLFLILGSLGLLGSLLLDFQIATLESKQNWRTAAVFIASSNSIRLAFLSLLIILGKLSVFNVLLVFFTSSLLAFLLSTLWQKVSIGFQEDWKKTLKEVVPFSGWMGANRIVGAINSRLDVLLLLQLATPFETGIYAAARQLAQGVPIAIGSFATVLAPRFATFEGEGRKAFFKKTVLLSIIISAGILFGVLFAKPIMNLFGERFRESVSVLQWLLAAMVPFALATPAVNALVYAFHKPRVVAILSFLQLPLIFFGNIYLIPKIGVFGPVVILGIWNLSTLVVAYLFSWHYFKAQK